MNKPRSLLGAGLGLQRQTRVLVADGSAVVITGLSRLHRTLARQLADQGSLAGYLAQRTLAGMKHEAREQENTDFGSARTYDARRSPSRAPWRISRLASRFLPQPDATGVRFPPKSLQNERAVITT